MTESAARLRGYSMALAVLGVDQLTKRLALSGLELHSPVEVLGQLFRLTLAWNSGAAFSLPWGGPLFLAVITGAAAVLVAVFIWRLASRSTVYLLGLGAILGGALGNFLDRLFYGSVVDFIDVGIGLRRWPVFNVADIAITVGGLIVFLAHWKTSSRSGSEED